MRVESLSLGLSFLLCVGCVCACVCVCVVGYLCLLRPVQNIQVCLSFLPSIGWVGDLWCSATMHVMLSFYKALREAHGHTHHTRTCH